MAAPIENDVDLGFVEDVELFLLQSRFFPSKFGGKPAWLSLDPIPEAKKLSCRICSKPTTFLMQVYSPDNSKNEEAFHRTIFVFVCRNGDCNSSNSAMNFHVLRSQLGKVNKFYSPDPPKEVRIDKEIDASLYGNVCGVCGCSGPKTCAKCHKVSYCSKEHQTVDWKAGHKKSCSTVDFEERRLNHSSILFTEKELVTELENYKEKKEEKNDSTKMKEYSDFMKTEKSTEVSEQLSSLELEKMANTETENDKQLKRFRKRISHEPEQVLRYDKGGEPLWITASPIPADIPNCTCGGKRQFEFQIMPQLLTHMAVDELGASLDWGTVCVYTCMDSCSIGNQYVPEYIYKQDIV